MSNRNETGLETVRAALEPGEILEAGVFGPVGGYERRPSSNNAVPQLLRGAELEAFLAACRIDGGFGDNVAPSMMLWTDRRVFFVDRYDGRTSLSWVYRNPTACRPAMPGGG